MDASEASGRRFWIGAVAALIVGLVYGGGLGHLTSATMNDPYQPSPAFAAMGVFFGGALAGLILVPLVLGAIYMVLMAGHRAIGRGLGCATVLGLASLGAVAGFWLMGGSAAL